MRVAIDGSFWNQPYTGSGQYLKHLWEALTELSSNVAPEPGTFSLLLPPFIKAAHALPDGPHSQVMRTPGLPVLTEKVKGFSKLMWEQWGVARQARKQKAQLLHVPYLSSPFLKSCPTVVTAHDMIPWVVPGYKGSRLVRIYLAIAAASVKRADLIIADSEASRRDVIRVLKVPPQKVHTVYLGVGTPPDYTNAQLDEVRSRFGLPTNFAFYIGGFDPRKNVPLLLRAWRGALQMLCPERCEGDKSVLAIAGTVPKPGGLFPDLRGESKSLGLDGPDGSVRFLGKISDEEKFMLMAAARLFVFPSSYEGFGLDPLEAMSVGCPVVSSSGGSLSEVVGDAGLLVPPGDEEALSQAIVRVWNDDTLRADLSMKGRSRARSFTWNRTAEQTRDLYNLVLERSYGS